MMIIHSDWHSLTGACLLPVPRLSPRLLPWGSCHIFRDTAARGPPPHTHHCIQERVLDLGSAYWVCVPANCKETREGQELTTSACRTQHISFLNFQNQKRLYTRLVVKTLAATGIGNCKKDLPEQKSAKMELVWICGGLKEILEFVLAVFIYPLIYLFFLEQLLLWKTEGGKTLKVIFV